MNEVEHDTPPTLQTATSSDRLVWSGTVRIGCAADVEEVGRELVGGAATTTSVSGKLIDSDGRRVADVYPFTMRTSGCAKEWGERLQEHLMGCVHPVVCQMYARQLPGPVDVSVGSVVDAARAALLGTVTGGFVWDVSVCVYRTKATFEFVSAAASVPEAVVEEKPRWSEESNKIYEEYKSGCTSYYGKMNRLLLKRIRSMGTASRAIPVLRLLRELPIEEQLDMLEDDEKVDAYLKKYEEGLEAVEEEDI